MTNLNRAGATIVASALLALMPVSSPLQAAGPAGAADPVVVPWVVVADLDHDGRDDVVRMGEGEGEVFFGQPGGGSGAGAIRSTERVSLQGGGADAAVALDVDGDGMNELLVWHRSGGSDAALLRLSTSGLNARRSWRSERVSAPPPSTQAFVVDINGDGRDDVLWHGPAGVDALDRARAGSAGPSSSGAVFGREIFGALGALAPKVGDFDGDEVGDVLWYDPAGGAGAMWWGGPTISAAPFNIGTGMVLHVGQWDGDGATDLLVGGDNGNVELDGQANRRFTAEVVPPQVVSEAVVGDVNGDGRDDLIELGASAGVWNNDSGGWLWEPWEPPGVPLAVLADGSWNVVAADLDGDQTDEVLRVPLDELPWSAGEAMWKVGYRREAIYRETNPYAAGGLVIRMLGITGGRRVDPPLLPVHDACGALWPVHAEIADQVQAMLSDAAATGLGICINSSYRSYAEQVAIRSRVCAQGGFAGNRDCIYEWRSGRLPFVGGNQVARPGHSRHQLGIAVDLGDFDGYATAPVTSWLSANAHRYGLYNLGDRHRLGPGFVWGSGGEPWHVSIDGR